jgi:hypothetical protein
VTKANWRDHLTSKAHTLEYQKFFDGEIDKAGGDWRRVVEEYLFSSDAPIVNGMCGGCESTFERGFEAVDLTDGSAFASGPSLHSPGIRLRV